jgi:hypothetical protein
MASFVIPAEAGIQITPQKHKGLDARFRGNNSLGFRKQPQVGDVIFPS